VKSSDFLTDDEEKEDEDGFSIIAMWNWERKNYFIKEYFNKRAKIVEAKQDKLRGAVYAPLNLSIK
ncbi:TPA: hypothetical protein PR884_002637, partial [Staphylococcus aureus]|nr:hypothetical protein [Staphylococcus aureus]HCZ7781514.1 hypothetical protein [Staphylococcus aureus]HDK3671498.1 hypothetical protein [Staphylococcus aureus]HDK3682157.1 hypothetical protein [Staphylococcus aureus]